VAWTAILRALWLFLPAYLANMAPVFVAKLVPRWNARIDGGRVDGLGRPILGLGKTWRGLVGGTVVGALVALALSYLAFGIFAADDFGRSQGASPWLIAAFGAVVGCMALVGDFVKSYFKRRIGKEGGSSWFPFDQLDFVVGGLAGVAMASPLLPGGWARTAFLGDPLVLVTLLVLTPLLHLLVNRIGFWLGLKTVPW
jgi:CDP-2,3-bis-(O-geranylgeranyl)-sn-glycerol synthase